MTEPSLARTQPDPVLEPFDGRAPSAADTRADAMARFEGDEVFYDRIVPLFRQAASEQAAALRRASDDADATALQHWAHTLKGSLLTVGAGAAAAHAEEIERAAMAHRLEGIAPRVRRLVAETALIVAHLTPGAG